MSSIVIRPSKRSAAVEIDLVADFTCPWSWLGMQQLSRALQSLAGAGEPRLRWHPFRVPTDASLPPQTFRDYLAARLPAGATVEGAERRLAEAGRDFGISFQFDKLGRLPQTAEAHRLVYLAQRDGRQADVAAAIFRAYFEFGLDIGASEVLQRIAVECGLSEATQQAFAATREGERELTDSEERLRGFGVRAVPNLLLNRRVLVPGAVDVPTYVQALDQALFPSLDPQGERPTLH
jgi:predicted DsbA family dithiol-disulfide isomerase